MCGSYYELEARLSTGVLGSGPAYNPLCLGPGHLGQKKMSLDCLTAAGQGLELGDYGTIVAWIKLQEEEEKMNGFYCYPGGQKNRTKCQTGQQEEKENQILPIMPRFLDHRTEGVTVIHGDRNPDENQTGSGSWDGGLEAQY